MEWMLESDSAQKVDPEEENDPATPQRVKPKTFRWVLHTTTELSPLIGLGYNPKLLLMDKLALCLFCKLANTEKGNIIKYNCWFC